MGVQLLPAMLFRSFVNSVKIPCRLGKGLRFFRLLKVKALSLRINIAEINQQNVPDPLERQYNKHG